MHNIDISIIVATRNREQILWKSILKAAAAIEGKHAEIIVINDGEPFSTVPVTDRGRVQYLDNGHKGVSAARNKGALHAKGDILFFIDDDMWINAEVIDWITVNLIENKKTGAVYNINWEYPQSLTKKLKESKVGRYILSSGYHTMWGRMHERGKAPQQGLYAYHSIGSCSLVMEKKLFMDIGMYSDLIIFQGEDIEFSNRLNRRGIPILAVFDLTLFHNQQDRLEIELFLKRLSHGYGSEFKAIKAGLIQPGDDRYKGAKKIFFELFRISGKGWIVFHKLIPDHLFFKPLANKVTGLLAGLARYKEWRNVFVKPAK
jgi:glycosyltransferase involved in cell wall biosynthesis